MNMTIKELSTLTMKDIKAYVLMKKPGTKAPKKWQDKTKCLAWAEKSLKSGAPDSPVKAPKKEAKVNSKAKPKPKKDKKVVERLGKARRHEMVKSLRTTQSTALELSVELKVKYKTVLDDIHAIRHERAEEVYLKDGEVLSDVRIGKPKAFFVCQKAQEEKKQQSTLKTIELV